MNETPNLIPFIEVVSKEKEPYTIVDSDGNKIEVSVPNPMKHNDHDDCNNPIVHFNVGKVITFYDNRYPSPKQDGDGSQTEIYEMDEFFAKSDFPGFDKDPRRSLRVLVRYDQDRRKGKNYTKTYYSFYR